MTEESATHPEKQGLPVPDLWKWRLGCSSTERLYFGVIGVSDQEGHNFGGGPHASTEPTGLFSLLLSAETHNHVKAGPLSKVGHLHPEGEGK